MTTARRIGRDARLHRGEYAIAGLMVVIAIVAMTTGMDLGELETASRPSVLAGWATIGCCLALVGRRRWPLRCVAIQVGLLFVLGLTDHSDTVGYLALLIGLYSAAVTLPARRAMRAVAMVLLLVVLSVVALGVDPASGLVGAGGAFVLGRLIRTRREHQDTRAAAARYRAAAELEIAQLAAAAERQRMAQELHDVVAHSLSVIAVQAGIGAHLVERRPVEAARALAAIRDASDAAAGELSRLVEVLRDGRPGGTEPAPGLGAVRELCGQVAAAGVPIDLAVIGDLDAPPTGVSLAAYRIVQEALTNVVRHAGSARTIVTIRADRREVEVEVDDDGPATSAEPAPERLGAGHGLVGMRERAQMYGGDATAGPRIGGGFRVHATLRAFAEPVAPEVAPALLPASPAPPGAARARRPVPPLLWDVALAIAFGAVAVVELADGPGRGDDGAAAFTPADGWAWVLKLGCCLLLAGRRRYPTWTLLASTVLAVTLTVGDYETGVVALVFVVGLYTVGSEATTARFVGALLGVGIAMGIVAWSDPPDLTTAGAAWTAMIALAAAAAGFVVRRDRDRRERAIADHEDAAVAQARHLQLAVTSERLRIAEELNRAITRVIRSISSQAGSGTLAVETDPAATLERLEAISMTSRDALGDLRRLLKRLRTDAAAPHAPLAGTVGSISTGPTP